MNLTTLKIASSSRLAVYPVNASRTLEPVQKPARKEHSDALKLACHYQCLLVSGKLESRATLARHLGVSRARVTQVLNRLLEPTGN